MDISGEKRIPAPREKVWAALHDPDVLRQCIPGCEALERNGQDAFIATAALRIGTLAGRFRGDVRIADIQPPTACRISGEGNDGVLGFARGGADVRLEDEAGTTVLRYDVQTHVGGEMAQLGTSVVDTAAKNMADQFFDRFTRTVGLGEIFAPASPSGTSDEAPAIAPAPINVLSMIPVRPFGYPRAVFIGGFLMAIVLFIMFIL